jgi:hypothetical protein
MPWVFRPNAFGEITMAGISAGVVTEAQVEGLPTAPSSTQIALGQPATWAYIWVALAFLYILGIYVGTIRISRRG